MADDEDSVLSQEDPPSGVEKQVSSASDAAVQVDQPQHAPVKVPPGQPSRTPLPQAAREVHVFVSTVAMPDPFRQGVPRFNGKNISRFIRDYEGMCRRYYIGEEHRLACLPDYCEDIYAEAIQVIPEPKQGE